jgi:hypothetical protein
MVEAAAVVLVFGAGGGSNVHVRAISAAQRLLVPSHRLFNDGRFHRGRTSTGAGGVAGTSSITALPRVRLERVS